MPFYCLRISIIHPIEHFVHPSFTEKADILLLFQKMTLDIRRACRCLTIKNKGNSRRNRNPGWDILQYKKHRINRMILKAAPEFSPGRESAPPNHASFIHIIAYHRAYFNIQMRTIYKFNSRPCGAASSSTCCFPFSRTLPRIFDHSDRYPDLSAQML